MIAGLSQWGAVARNRRGQAVVGVLCVLATACGTAGGQTGTRVPHTTDRAHGAPRLVPVQGGSVTVALDQVPTTLNDHTVAGDTEAGRMVASAVWAQVFRVGPGLVPQLDTNVVDSAEVVSLQPQTVVYKIDPRAVWSDGVPISADDFTYAWQSQKGDGIDIDGSPDSVASTLGYRDIASLTGSDGGRTVTVTFRTPFADWASLFDDLLPAHIAERVGWNHGFDHLDPSVLVSGGPWEVVSWKPGSDIVLGRNPRWWETPANLDRIDVRAVAGDGAVTSALGRAAVQVAYPSGFDQSFMAQASSSPVFQTQVGLGTSMLQLEFNIRHAPLNTIGVRQGIAHAIDRAGLVESVGQPEDPSTWEDNNHIFANSQSGYTDDAAGYEKADLATSAHLLAQNGMTLDGQGRWTEHGKPMILAIVWAADDPWSAAVGPVIAAQLVAAGFEIAASPMPAAQLYANTLPAGSFDLAVVPVDASAYPSTLGNVYSTAPTVVGAASSEDWSGYEDAKIDALFSQAVQNLDPPQAQAVYQQIDRELWSDMPTLPLFAPPTIVVSSSSLSGVGDDAGGLGPLWGMRLWTRLAAAPKRASATSGSAIGTMQHAR